MSRVSPLVFVSLLFTLLVVAVLKANSGVNVVRKRREWILPPTPLKENVDYTHMEFIGKIRSDFESQDDIEYSLEGIGASKEPYNVFVVDSKSGKIRVTRVLDREFISVYNLSGIARKPSGKEVEKRIDIRIKVLDENDNAPEFQTTKYGKVYELSDIDISVMNITATDKDEPGNENSQIAYSIIKQSPADDMFYITKDGTVSVKKSSLDREKADTYTLTVMGQDLNGKPGGKTGTGTVVIKVLDVNDNPPTLEKDTYEGSIEENTENVEVMRLKAEDLDLKGTDNWEAVFDIVKGNEAGYFSIKTDPSTNEGILMLDKAVDYEDVKALELGLVVKNKAPPYDGSVPPIATGAGGLAGELSSGNKFKTYPIKINVKNQPEGPAFVPRVKSIPISEGDTILGKVYHYPATDVDTGKPAENVRYAKGSDPDNWLTIDPKTADIKLNKRPDRESEFLINGTYYAQVLCITEDMPAKTATGTIAIQVEDFNDHCPTLTSDFQSMCTTDESVIVNARDEDSFPNGAPFDFDIVRENTKGKWQVEQYSDTAAILRAKEPMWPGIYEVEFLVTDAQGHSCPEPQKVDIMICTCKDTRRNAEKPCGERGAISKESQLGPAGIGLLLPGLLLLLLIPLLLLFCNCGGAAGLSGNFTEMPFDTKSHLINYHTEGQGDNTEVPLITMPTQTDEQMVKMGMANTTSAMVPMAAFDYQKSVTTMDEMNGAIYREGFSGVHREGTMGRMNQISGSGFYSEFESRESGVGGGLYDGMALPDHFLRQYYFQKANSGSENQGVKDSLLVYDFEGQGSSAGSVGCCSLLESDTDLQFLDDLGPKFKTLAEVCGGKKISTEVKQAFTPLPTPSVNTENSVSSVVTTQQLSPPPQLQPAIPKTVQNVVRETSQSSQVVKENTATMRQGMVNQGQMLLLQQQQPVYYTTTPVMQPMHYVVQPQAQNTMLLAEAPATNLQGMVLVNSTQSGPAQGMVIQGQPVMSTGQAQGPNIMMVEKSGVQGDGANLIHTGSQTMMFMKGKVPAESLKGLRGSQTSLVRSSDSSGSQRILYSKGGTFVATQSSSLGSSTPTVGTTPTYSKVMVQEAREIH
ncbi:desmoglein-2.1-like [Acanthopagrus schlegelii]